MPLEGKTAIVTGASFGIGRAITENLLSHGVRVAGMARRTDPLAQLTEQHGDTFLPLPCDVRDAPAVAEAVGSVHASFGRLDILVNNAGVGRFGPVQELAVPDWEEMLATNVSGVFHLTREVVPIMKRQESGHILTIASIAGLVGNVQLSGYNASKFAVRGFSEALMKELREDGIKVTCMFPGSVETSFSPSRRPPSTANKLRPEEVAEVVTHVLDRSENFLISEVVLRPLRTKSQ